MLELALAVVATTLFVAGAVAVYLYTNPALLIHGMHRLTILTNRLSIKYLVIDGNVTLAYFERGHCSEQTTTVVFIHGFSGSKEDLAGLTKGFRGQNYHLLALDLPGHGASSRDETTGVSPTYFVQSIKQFVDKLGLTAQNRKIHMVGHSMGGMLTAKYAASFPGDLASITLIAPGGMKCPLTQDLVKEYKDSNYTKCSILPSTEEEMVQLIETTFKSKMKLPRIIIAGVWQLREPGQGYYHRVFRTLISDEFYGCLEKFLPKIHIPVLLIWGKEDPVLHYESAAVIADKLPKPCETLLLDNCGHAPQFDHPEKTALAVSEFVNKYREQVKHSGGN